MPKIGRNELCPCGSGKKYKHCCLGSDPPFTHSTQETQDSVRRRLQEALAAGKVESLEDAQRIAADVMRTHNTTGVPEFHGLSPEEMQRLLSTPFSSPEIVRMPPMLDAEPTGPVVILFKSLVDGIGEGVAATANGNLPRKLVLAAADALDAHGSSEFPRRHSPRREDDFPELHATRVLAELTGLIELTDGQYTVTKRYRDLLAKGGMRRVYPELLRTYATEFNWAYRDGFDEIPSIQHTFLFTLYLLSRHGSEYRDSSFYEDAFLDAFPMAVREARATAYHSPAESVALAYTVRALNRFAGFFGLVDFRGDRPHLEFEVKATPLLADAVRFRERSDESAQAEH